MDEVHGILTASSVSSYISHATHSHIPLRPWGRHAYAYSHSVRVGICP